MQVSIFDQLFSTTIPGDLQDASGYVCLISQKRQSGTFSTYKDKTQNGVPSTFDTIQVQCDFKESGTGVFITKDTVITASHIVSPQPNNFKIFCGNRTYRVTKTAFYNDYAVLTVELLTKSTPPNNDYSSVRPFKGQIPSVGTKVFSLGYPYCCTDLRYFEGVITTLNEKTVSTSLPAVVGCSGSPVFIESPDLRGLFILGVVSSGAPNEADVFNASEPRPTCKVTLNNTVVPK